MERGPSVDDVALVVEEAGLHASVHPGFATTRPLSGADEDAAKDDGPAGTGSDHHNPPATRAELPLHRSRVRTQGSCAHLILLVLLY